MSNAIRHRRHLRLWHLCGDIYVQGECNSFLALVMMMLMMMHMVIAGGDAIILIIICKIEFGSGGLGSSGTAANN